MSLRISQHINLGNALKDTYGRLHVSLDCLLVNSRARRKAVKTLHVIHELSLELEKLLQQDIPAKHDPRNLLEKIYLGNQRHHYIQPETHNRRDSFHGWHCTTYTSEF